MTTETVETPAEETKVIPSLEELGSDDDLTSLVVMRAQATKSKLDKVAAMLNSVGNSADLLSEALKNSDNSDVQEYLKKIDLANEKILEWTKAAEELVKPTLDVPSDEDIKALEEQYKQYVSQIKTFDTVFVNEVKGAHPDLSIYDYVGDVPKAKRGGSTGAKAGQGEGSSRPRVSEVAVSTDHGSTYSKVDKDGKSTFSVLVGWLKKETGESIGATDLHEAWFEQNGNVKSWTDLPEQSTFNYSLNGKDYFIRVTK